MTIDGSRLQIAVQEEQHWRRRMSVTVPAAVVAEEERRATAHLASRVQMKGFRKGKVPSKVVESRFGGALRKETLDRIIGEAFRKAVEVQNLKPISEGEVDEVTYEPRQDLSFSIAFDVQPLIELPQLGGFSVERPPVRVSDEHVDEFLRGVREQHGVWQPVEGGTPTLGDLVSVRIRRLDDADPEATPEGKAYEFILGQGDAIPDIESAILSLTVGKADDFTVTFPADFPDETRRGAQERIHLELVTRKSMELPALDDEFATKVGSFESLSQLRERVREDLERDAREQAEAMVHGQLLELLLEANPFEVPRSMVERYSHAVLSNQPGLPKERIPELLESIRPEAERAVKRILFIERVAETQSLTATEEDLDRRIEDIAVRNQTSPDKVYSSMQKAGRLESLERDITESKVFEFLKQQSAINEAPAA